MSTGRTYLSRQTGANLLKPSNSSNASKSAPSAVESGLGGRGRVGAAQEDGVVSEGFCAGAHLKGHATEAKKGLSGPSSSSEDTIVVGCWARRLLREGNTARFRVVLSLIGFAATLSARKSPFSALARPSLSELSEISAYCRVLLIIFTDHRAS